MHVRCYDRRHPKYENYGGRGILVCDRWRNNFVAFLEDMGKRPTKAHTLERKNSNLPYTPDNCIWATRTEQNRNKRTNIWVTIDGTRKLLIDWCREAKVVPYSEAHRRINQLGWDAQKAIFTPPRQCRKGVRT